MTNFNDFLAVLVIALLFDNDSVWTAIIWVNAFRLVRYLGVKLFGPTLSELGAWLADAIRSSRPVLWVQSKRVDR